MGGFWKALSTLATARGRLFELSAFTSTTFVHGRTETAWVETAFNPAEVKSL